MEEKITVIIATDVIIFLAQHGLLRHNQIYDTFYDMDTNKSSSGFTIETIAMIDGVSKIVNESIIKINETK